MKNDNKNLPQDEDKKQVPKTETTVVKEKTNDELRAEVEAKKQELERITLNKELADLNDKITKANEIPIQRTSSVVASKVSELPPIKQDNQQNPLEANDPSNLKKEIYNKNNIKNEVNNNNGK